MFKHLFKCMYSFSKITPQLFPQIKGQFQKDFSLKGLGEYYTAENTEPLFNMIVQTKMSTLQLNTALDQLTQLCSTENDQSLNVLVNIVNQKAIINSRINNLPQAISDFQRAISLTLQMKAPDKLALPQFYKIIGDLYLRINDFKQARKYLKQAISLFKQLTKQEEVQVKKFAHSCLAIIHSQLSMILYRQKKLIQSSVELKIAFDEWQNVPVKSLQQYELSCRLKCMLQLKFQQKKVAVQTAKYFLKFLHQSNQYKTAQHPKRFIFTKLYYLNVICNNEKSCKQEQNEIKQLLTDFKKERGEDKMIELMIANGVSFDRYDV